MFLNLKAQKLVESSAHVSPPQYLSEKNSEINQNDYQPIFQESRRPYPKEFTTRYEPNERFRTSHCNDNTLTTALIFQDKRHYLPMRGCKDISDCTNDSAGICSENFASQWKISRTDQYSNNFAFSNMPPNSYENLMSHPDLS